MSNNVFIYQLPKATTSADIQRLFFSEGFHPTNLVSLISYIFTFIITRPDWHYLYSHFLKTLRQVKVAGSASQLLMTRTKLQMRCQKSMELCMFLDSRYLSLALYLCHFTECVNHRLYDRMSGNEIRLSLVTRSAGERQGYQRSF